MPRLPHAVVSGALTVKSSSPVLQLEVESPRPVMMTFEVRPAVCDIDEFEMESNEISATSTICGNAFVNDAQAKARQNVLKCSALYRGRGELRLPAGAQHPGAALIFIIESRPLPHKPETIGGVSDDTVESYRLDVTRRQIHSHRNADGKTLLWMATKAQRDARFDAIVAKYDLLHRKDRPSQKMLTNLCLALATGLDSPLWTADL